MHSKKTTNSLAKRFIESAGILFTLLLVSAGIVYAFTTWSSGEAPQAAPGDGNVQSIGGSAYISLLVRHSQTTSIPATPTGWTKLWDGYSYVLTAGGGEGYSGTQDLGTTGSCLPDFRPMPFIECGSWNTCDYYTGGDYSYWLSTYPSTADDGPINGKSNIGPKISRCAVFEADKPLLVRHSQTTSIPATPTGWTKLWDGYSYALTAGGAGYSGTQDLGTTGSCLPDFRPMPFIECGSWNTCDYYTGGDYSYWLSTYPSTADDGPINGKSNIGPKIGRCAVFTK